MNILATIEIRDTDHYARATFSDANYPESYAIYVEPGNDTPFQVNDGNDADQITCRTWDSARDWFLQTVADYIRDNIA